MDPELQQASQLAKDPTTYSWLTYFWVIWLSAWGGLVQYWNSIRGQQIPVKRILVDMAVGASTSSFVGVVTFFLCEYANITGVAAAVCVAISGHMGTKALSVLEVLKKLKVGA